MRRGSTFPVPVAIALVAALVGVAPAAAVPPHVNLPLAQTTVTLRDGRSRRVVVHGQWRGSAGTLLPGTYGARLRIVGGPGEGDSGVIVLPASRWQRTGAELRYHDPTASAGGIRSVRLRTDRAHGSLEIRGGTNRWRYALAQPQTRVDVTLELDQTWICGGVAAARLRQHRGRLAGRSNTPPASCPCALTIDSTWDAIQQLIFDRHTCRQAVCHGGTPGTGNLDLEVGRAYQDLVGVPSTDDPDILRVNPGSAETSMLWRKLAARTLHLAGVPLSPMPITDPPLSSDELDALARWIAAGAPETGVVPDTAAGLGVCLGDP